MLLKDESISGKRLGNHYSWCFMMRLFLTASGMNPSQDDQQWKNVNRLDVALVALVALVAQSGTFSINF